jgi:16S rRNA (adenine1518-N6/adenine1519-N6)-dimethyltransferase
MLEGLGLTGLVRAEAMNVEEFLSLADALQARFGSLGTEAAEEDSSAAEESEAEELDSE